MVQHSPTQPMTSPDAWCFKTTHWSMVLAAGNGGDASSEGPLETLCRQYWQPLHAFARQKGYSPEEAQDLTQGFFAHVLEGNVLNFATPERGRFRTFLLAAFKNFVANDWNRGQRLKRGGGREFLSWEELATCDEGSHEPVHDETPERNFDRQWAQTMLKEVLVKLRTEMDQAGAGARFDHLKGYLTGNAPDSYSEVAKKVGLSEPAIKSAIFRLRQRFGQLVREHVAQTVSSPAEVDAEIRYLFAVSAQ